uniref:Rho guanine nucleotide exchange factor 38 n=1 Tax=Hippocampus comes TaxID=109280 RepID=A0A3Q2XEM9_HIPCM
MTPHDLSSPASPALDPEEVRSRKMNRRSKVIQELMQTEKDYLTDLELCIREVIDVDRLFTNMETVCGVSAALLNRLEEAMCDSDPEAVIIGEVFIQAKAALEDVYKIYCYHHDDANMVHIEQHIQGKPHLLDMGSLLIKPVQRIMKYPLLLGELWQATPEDHPDSRPLQEAFTATKIINININEFKRRKDIGEFDDADRTLCFYFRLQVRDEVFDREEKLFRSLEKAVRQLVKNVQSYLHLPSVTPKRRSVKAIGTQTSNVVFSQKDNMERLVLAPLTSLQGMFTAPQKLIQKRYDKLLDYCSRLERSSFSPSSSSSRDYEALNALLVEELQRFNMASYAILTNCAVYVVVLLRGLMEEILLGVPSVQQLPVSGQRRIAIPSQSWFATLPPISMPLILQEQRARLLAEFPPSRLYQLKRKCNGCQKEDLSLLEGELVALLEDTDPMGSSSRWLVHTGGKFVITSVHQVTSHKEGKTTQKAIQKQGQPNPRIYLPPLLTNASCFFSQYYAVYAFQARCDQELTLQEYQHVRILQFNDLGGNKEWWLAEVDGQRGYVPANYLERFQLSANSFWDIPSLQSV